jgi:hypothetical protein
MLWLVRSGIANVAIAVWTLQHCFKPEEDIRNIYGRWHRLVFYSSSTM